MPTPDLKRERILDSSLAVFCRYGFRKTSMQDIAEEAGVSRAALYLLFANKEDVFRSGSIRAHDRVLDEVRRHLADPEPVFVRIEAALVAHFDGLMREISESPHGRELFDASVELVGDIVGAAREEFIALIAAAWEQAEERGEVSSRTLDATSQQLAALLVAGVDGLKQARAPHLPVRGGIALQLRMLEAAAGVAD